MNDIEEIEKIIEKGDDLIVDVLWAQRYYLKAIAETQLLILKELRNK